MKKAQPPPLRGVNRTSGTRSPVAASDSRRRSAAMAGQDGSWPCSGDRLGCRGDILHLKLQTTRPLGDQVVNGRGNNATNEACNGIKHRKKDSEECAA